MKTQSIKLRARTVSIKHLSPFLIMAMTALTISSCSVENTKFYRGDVIGFSDRVETSYSTESRGLFMNYKPQSAPYNLLTEDGKIGMQGAIYRVPRGNNTTAYYAMELAAQRVKYIRKKIAKNDPNTRYYIFLLTDGLDNASPQVAKNDKRVFFSMTPEQYENRVRRKLKNAMGWFGKKNEFVVYPMMYEGEDMQESKNNNKLSQEEFDDLLKRKMDCFRYSSLGKDKAPDLISANDFSSIIEELKKQLALSSYTFKVPKSYAGKKIRMTFLDSINREVTVTATLKKSFLSYSLCDIKLSNGATIRDGKTTLNSINLDESDNVNAYFVIEDFRLGGIAYYPDGQRVTQDYEAESGFWQRNSEYQEASEDAINTYFILVIDGSKSLDGKNGQNKGFEEETRMARKILSILAPRRY